MPSIPKLSSYLDDLVQSVHPRVSVAHQVTLDEFNPRKKYLRGNGQILFTKSSSIIDAQFPRASWSRRSTSQTICDYMAECVVCLPHDSLE